MRKTVSQIADEVLEKYAFKAPVSSPEKQKHMEQASRQSGPYNPFAENNLSKQYRSGVRSSVENKIFNPKFKASTE